MDCEQAVALISARLDHEIQPDDRVRLDLHLRHCSACRAVADAFALQHQGLRDAFEPRRKAVAASAEKVNAHLPSARPPRPKSDDARGLAVRAAMVLAAVAASAAIVLVARQWFEPPYHTTESDLLKPLALALTEAEELTPRPRSEAPPATKLAVGESVETRAGEKRRMALPDGSILYVNENTKGTLEADRHMKLTSGTVYVEVAPRSPDADGSTFTVETPRGPVQAFGTKFEVAADADKGVSVLVTQGRVTFDQAAVAAGQQVLLPPVASPTPQPTPAPRGSHLLDWTRDLMAAAESPLVPASEYDGGALVAVDPYGQEAKLSLRNYHIDVHVEDGFARTTIDQTYFNNTPWRLEGTFYFPLPPDASLSRLAMYVDGNLMEGGMTDRDYGNAVYEKVVRAKRDPALLEWVDGSTFKMRVFPLEGRQEKRIILSYTQRLPTLYGRTQYRFPAGHSLQVVDHWSFHAVVKNAGGVGAGLPRPYWNSPTHSAMRGRYDGDDLVLDAAETACKVDRDVEVDLIDPQENNSSGERARFSAAEQDGAGYLMLRFRPELPAAPVRQRRDWVFLFESSADRDPLLARAQIDIIRHMLEHVEHDDTFAVLTAGTTTRRFADAPLPATPENVAAALAFLERTHLVGALDLGRALADAAPLLQAGTNPYLVHVGSGLTAMGRRQEALAGLIAPGVRYIGIGVGKHWGRSWMKERAESSGGYFTQINPDEPIAWRAFDLISTLDTPRLLHVQVAPGDDAEQVGAGLPRPYFLTDQALVAQGEEVCAVVQVPRSADGILILPRSVVVTGVLDGQPYRRELPVQEAAPHADYLPRTWAKWEIDRLLAVNPSENKAKIVELSKAMYVMTPFTSLLVLENEAMYKEFNVDRGRKDHWAMYPCPQTIPVVFEPDPTQPIDVRNAPKTPKPVANLVLPTVVTRGAPRFLGGQVVVDQRKSEGELKRLKKDLFSQERLVAQVNRNDEYHFTAGRVVALDNSSSFFSDFPSRGTEQWSAPRISPVDRILGSIQLSETTVTTGPQMDSLMLNWGEERRTKGRILTSDLGKGRILTSDLGLGYGMALGQTPAGEKRSVRAEPAVVDHAVRLYSAYASYSDNPPPRPGTQTDSTTTLTKADAMYRRRIEAGWTPTLLYQPPTYTGDAHLFSDLVSYAPSLNTTEADVMAVLDAEAAPNLSDAPGHIDPDARRLIDQSRRPRWRTLTLSGDKDTPSLQFHFDGAGRYAVERTLPLGLHERVVCDGETLWHLYPELGLAARRTVSRFHRAEVADLTPWALPPVEDLARGADVESVDAHTVALVPLGATTRRTDDDKPAPYYRLMLLFADDGRLTERRLEEAPAGKVVRRETYDDNGGVRVLDADGKEMASDHAKVADAAAPDLSADVRDLVVVRIPLRSRAKVFADVGLDASRPLADEMNGCYVYLQPEQAVELLAGAMTEGNADEARRTFRDCFEARGDLRRGLFTLLSAAGVNVCSEPGFPTFLSDHKDDPLARYFALLGNAAYDFLHRRTGLDVGFRVGPEDGLFGRLAEFHDLETRWNGGASPWIDPALRRADEKRTFDFIRRNRDNVLGWAMQIHVQNHARFNDDRLHLALAETWAVLAGDGAYTGRYEQARCLFRAGKRDEARQIFLDLYGNALKSGVLPPIDGDFRDALRGGDDDAWSALMWRTATEFVRNKDRPDVVLLAWQCRQAGDEPLSDNLLAFALDRVPTGADGKKVMLAAVEYLWRTDQLPAADELLRGLLNDEANAGNADLWRLASELAERRGMSVRAGECLEKALDLEYRDLPPVIDLQAWRSDYRKLLAFYQTQTTAPPGLAARTIQAADRWRAHDPDSADACRTAAAVLQALGEREAAWEYLTTPAALPTGSVSWSNLAQDLGRQGDLNLAERSFAVACEQDPDNALILWQRAMNLRQAGRAGEADALLHRLADGEWPGPWQWVKAQARWQLDRK